MAVIEALCLADDFILHGTTQAPTLQDDLTHGSSVARQPLQNTRLTLNGGYAEVYVISANDGSWPTLDGASNGLAQSGHLRPLVPESD
jgi:hypothetical protein